MISSGTLTITVPVERVEKVSEVLEGLGTRFAFVGRVTEGVGVRVVKDSRTIHHTHIRCEEDELARMWALSLVTNNHSRTDTRYKNCRRATE